MTHWVVGRTWWTIQQRILLQFSSFQSLDWLSHRGEHDGRFSSDHFPVFSAGGPCEQFWYGQWCPLFSVVYEEVRAKIQQAIGPHEDLLMIVKRHKLQWYGHVSCSSGLAETILQGTVKGGRRQSRQRKRWEDNIREWPGLEFANGQWSTGKNGGNWFRSHLWCLNDHRG